MLLGKRPRHPIKRTTSMTGIRPDSGDVEFEEPASGGGDQNAAYDPPLSTAVVHNYSASISSPRNSRVQSVATDHFLRTCGLCKRRLAPARDIFIYRGDTAYCSSECREKQIKEDEKTQYGGGKKRDDRRPPPSTVVPGGTR